MTDIANLFAPRGSPHEIEEGAIFARTFIHSIVLTLILVALVAIQQFLLPQMIPGVPASP